MTLSAPRPTPERVGSVWPYPVAANAVIHGGALVCLSATGQLVPGSTATTLTAVGRAEESVDNTGGADGALTCEVKRGAFGWDNSGTDPVAAAQVGKTVYIVDDHTVAATDGAGTRSAAGKCLNVDANLGVTVES
ncbi:MAG: hypothetical protein K9H18_19540 [Rhodospirillum sp.]|nr:hypothetical protein [Rhodospirillum sp.]MCF8500189.1 hypothetical protein [Rhodospirillum sp.]